MTMRSLFLLLLAGAAVAAEKPYLEKEDIFPLDARHNHASSILRLPNGDLFVCWYRGSGERDADDVAVMGARKKKGGKAWSAPFVLADTPGFPDTNPTLFLDSQQRMWLFWQVIVANRWETAITKYRMATDLSGDGAPRWAESDILLLKPVNIAERVKAFAGPVAAGDSPLAERAKRLIENAADKYFSRMGWMTRAHPTELPDGRILVGLYSDGYSMSLVGISDDRGRTWHASEPIVGAGNIQPSIVRRRDGSLMAFMRDNGPPPKRVHWSESRDRGETWTPARDTDIPNSGTGLEARLLQDGRWLMINNDTETTRNSLALTISDDEGKTWRWKRHIELDARPKGAGSFHYPSIVQAPDGSIHASYSVFHNDAPKGQPNKTIRHAHFNLAWVEQGDR
jgi:predicted neuraminidase